MKAAVITRFGGPDVLDILDRPTPLPKPNEILVRVHATALNRADLHQREGNYPAPPGAPADIPGLEFAGEVAGVGHDVKEWREGDRVFGIVPGGGNAEFLVTDAKTVARIPDNLEWTDAAAVPEAFITAHDAMVVQARLQANEHVLIHAVGSGVGLAAAQLCRALGMRCLGTARTAEKLERAREFGVVAGLAIEGNDLAPLAPFVAERGAARGADVALDLVGGPYLGATIGAMAPLGRVILIGTLAGARGEIDFGRILRQRLTVRGTVLRARPIEERIAVTRRFGAEVGPLLASGAVRAVIDSRFPLERLAEAHARLESNDTFGKVVVELAS
jgi:putative PIG3 family NAD(P)H quinone oxidoreductase